jgi:hypothetical protein
MEKMSHYCLRSSSYSGEFIEFVAYATGNSIERIRLEQIDFTAEVMVDFSY